MGGQTRAPKSLVVQLDDNKWIDEVTPNQISAAIATIKAVAIDADVDT